MQILPRALFIVLLELTVGSFVSLVLLDLRGDTSRSFVKFQGVLYVAFGVLTLLAMNAFASPEIVRGDGLDDAWVRAQGPLALLFTVLLVPWNVLLFSDRPPAPEKGKKAKVAKGQRPPLTPRARLRFALGGVTALVGLATLFAVGMAYRTLASAHLGGAFVVLSFLAGGVAIGGVMTAMLLGHWYLNTPTASGKPLEFVTALLLGALAAELAFTLLIGPSTARPNPNAQVVAPGTVIQTNGHGDGEHADARTHHTARHAAAPGTRAADSTPDTARHRRDGLAPVPDGPDRPGHPGRRRALPDARPLVPVRDGDAVPRRQLHLHRRGAGPRPAAASRPWLRRAEGKADF
jgi:hypothetical protein